MEMNIDPGWLSRMAEKENGKIVSVGGFVTQLQANTDVGIQLVGNSDHAPLVCPFVPQVQLEKGDLNE